VADAKQGGAGWFSLDAAGPFSQIGKLWTDPVLEALAIKGLADSDPQVE
jgi:hypothetical protein